MPVAEVLDGAGRRGANDRANLAHARAHGRRQRREIGATGAARSEAAAWLPESFAVRARFIGHPRATRGAAPSQKLAAPGADGIRMT